MDVGLAVHYSIATNTFHSNRYLGGSVQRIELGRSLEDSGTRCGALSGREAVASLLNIIKLKRNFIEKLD